jgi:hypothetical protein
MSMKKSVRPLRCFITFFTRSRVMELAFELIERRRAPPERRRERRRALEAPVAHPDRLRVLAQALRRLLRHLPRADEEDGAAPEIAEDPLREIDRDARDRDRPRADLGLAPHPLRDGERAGDAAREVAPERARRDRGVVRLLHLPQDLGLAEDHRVEARGDAEDVAHRFLAGALVEVVRELLRARRADLLPERLADRLRRVLELAPLREADDLDAVARREEHRLLELGALGQAREELGEDLGAGGEALADVDRRGLVREADDDDGQAHGAIT